MKKKIAIVGDFIPGSGLTKYLENVFSKFSADKYDIIAVKYGGSDEVDAELKAYGWRIESVTPIRKGIINHFKSWKKIINTLNAYEIDVVHFNYSSDWNFIGVLVSYFNGTHRIIIHSHSSYFANNSNNKLTMIILNVLHRVGKIIFNYCADVKIATSDGAMRWMFGDKNNVRIISNGIEIKQYEYNESLRKKKRKEIGIINSETKVLGFIGTLVDGKNPLFAIKVFEKFWAENHNSKMFIYGDGPQMDDLKNYVVSKNLINEITFCGIVNDIPAVMQALDYFVFPSKFEGYGLVLAEAEASGLHSVTTINIPDDVIINKLTTKISLTESPSKWADYINEDINYNRVSEVELLYLKGFDISRVIGQMEEAYEQLLVEKDFS